MKYVLAFDQGTTSSRSIVFDSAGGIVGSAQREFRQIFPRPGWVEHDPVEIWTSQASTAVYAMRNAEIRVADLAAIGITNQRETTIIWERATGNPIYNAIVWQDRRTSEFCSDIRRHHSDEIRKRTGLEVDPYFSASKIRWILENIPDARKQAEKGELAFGTIDTWLVWNLTGGRLHVTDVSNASRTMLFNIETGEWDDDLLTLFNIPLEILPDVRSSSEIYGEAETPAEILAVPIAGIAGDQQAALFGQACFDPGCTKCTYGTGCFVLRNIGDKPLQSHSRLLTTAAWRIGNRTDYALEGSVFIGGAVVQWLRDSLGIIENSGAVEALAKSVDDNGGVYFVPAFAGLGSPHWDAEARGLIIGLTRGTGQAHIARAAIESIAFQTADLLEAMESDSGAPLSEIRVDGGAVGNELLMQFQADILQIPVVRSRISETTALGAAYLAGLAAGVWTSKSELAAHWRADRIFDPRLPAGEAKALRERWKMAVSRSLEWEK